MADDAAMPVNGSMDEPQAGPNGGRPALGEDLRAIGALTRDVGRDAEAVAREWIAPNPYAALLIAVGVGYVLGGGLPRILSRRVLRLGGRFAADMLVARYLTGAAEPRPEM